jgi:hypothetical protein
VPEEILTALESGKFSTSLRRLAATSQALHSNPVRSDRPQLEAELDTLVARLYGLTDAHLQAMRDWYSFITPHGGSVPPPQGEEQEE